jgi:hypothetical protein
LVIRQSGSAASALAPGTRPDPLLPTAWTCSPVALFVTAFRAIWRSAFLAVGVKTLELLEVQARPAYFPRCEKLPAKWRPCAK